MSNRKENVSIDQHANVVGFLKKDGSIETGNMAQASAFHRLFRDEAILVDSTRRKTIIRICITFSSPHENSNQKDSSRFSKEKIFPIDSLESIL
jgi:hypothetical protein